MSTDNSTKVPESGLRRKRGDQALALLWVIVGGVIATQCRDLDYMAEYGPGPGFLPSWLAGGFIVMGIGIFAHVTFRGKEMALLKLPDRNAARQMLLVLAGFFGFVLLAEPVGFMVCIGLLFFFLLTVVEKQTWKFSLAIAFFNALLFWVIFEVGLKLRLPPGLLKLLRL